MDSNKIAEQMMNDVIDLGTNTLLKLVSVCDKYHLDIHAMPDLVQSLIMVMESKVSSGLDRIDVEELEHSLDVKDTPEFNS